jgi:hypothetical protein
MERPKKGKTLKEAIEIQARAKVKHAPASYLFNTQYF